MERHIKIRCALILSVLFAVAAVSCGKEEPQDNENSGNTVTFIYRGEEVTYGIVEGANGRLWMDRNLGASQVATSTTDELAYGDLVQYGRRDDGHQDRGSSTTTNLSKTYFPHNYFILSQAWPFDWLEEQQDALWLLLLGTNTVLNNICPEGWVVPWEADFHAEILSWDTVDAAGAFASPLKLTLAGNRNRHNGNVQGVGTWGSYWSRTTRQIDKKALNMSIYGASVVPVNRAYGLSVRCIKDEDP